MKCRFLFFILLFWLASNLVFPQKTYDIVLHPDDNNSSCQYLLNVFQEKPKEVRFSIEREGSNLYFMINDIDWFNSLMKNPNDGIAVDIVVRDIYSCKYEFARDTQIRGLLQKPVYCKELKSGLKPLGENIYRVLVAKVPEAFVNDELEYNILFLSDKNLCNYYWTYHLESYPWDLLDMGMFLDSLNYKNKQIKPLGEESYVFKSKSLIFKIPFEKNKSKYSQEDIKPIYDSLKLTNFNIRSIDLKAYSSVEGGRARNLELQQERAQSIVEALQSFQKPTIETKVSSSENWVEFLNDIKTTEYAYLASFSKAEIKEKLVGGLSSNLEPVLMNHRKAIVVLGLEKRDRYNELDSSELLVQFNSAIENDKLEKALEMQNSIFEKIKSKVISPETLRKMEVPRQDRFVKIFNKNSAFRFMQNENQIFTVYNELLDLEKLVPENGEVKYNLVAVKLKLWRSKTIQVDELKLKSQINALKNYGIDGSLISRMMVNYHIIKAENFMRERDYENKDKSIDFINDNYKKFPLSDYDYLSLSQFFSYYANTSLSVALLENKVKTIDVNENLLFYYLNLTLIDRNMTSNSEYRMVMLNAINMNPSRFCKLFNSIERGGVTFQMLSDEYLRKTYCENCTN